MLNFKIKSIISNLGKRKNKTLFYAQQQGCARLPFEVLCQRIETATALSEADVLSCLHALTKVFEEELLQGKTVELPPIGSFRLVAGSKRMDTEKEVTVHTVGKVRVRFSPSKRLTEVAAKVPLSIQHSDDKKGKPASPSEAEKTPPSPPRDSGGL